MFGTTLDREYGLIARDFGLSPQKLKELALAGLAASWLDDGTKQAWLTEWSQEIDRLMASELTS
jgi:adenosine deaminase